MSKHFIFTLSLVVAVLSSTTAIAMKDPEGSASRQSKTRILHAKELLGGKYRKSAVRKTEKEGDISEFIRDTVENFLPKASRKISKKLAKAIIQSAQDFEFDPVFLMAVIQNESSFNPAQRGGAGEIGLMQIKPDTAAWIAHVYHVKYQGEKSLLDPVQNVRLGAALMHKLKHQFESESRLYLSAYNIGARKVRTMVKGQKIPKEYVLAVMKRYIAIYSAFKVKASSHDRSLIAYQHTLDLTKSRAKKTKAATPAALGAQASAVASNSSADHS